MLCPRHPTKFLRENIAIAKRSVGIASLTAGIALPIFPPRKLSITTSNKYNKVKTFKVIVPGHETLLGSLLSNTSNAFPSYPEPELKRI